MDEWGFLPTNVQWELDRNNSMLVLALLAGLTGAGLAAAEGMHRQSWGRVLIGVGVWTVVAAALGSLAGYLGHRVFEFLRQPPRQEMDELHKAILVAAIQFGIAGSGVGLGAGAFLGWSPRRCLPSLGAGFLVGLLAALIYPFVVAVLLPGAMTSVLLPVEPIDRALWVGLPMGLLGLAVPGVVRRSSLDPQAAS